MFIQLQRQSDHPLYLQVADHLRMKIEEGELLPNTRLPASRTLAKKLGVNRITIVNAYAELEAEGLVVSRVGSGTFVAADRLSTSKPVDAPRWQGTLAQRRPWSANQMLVEMMQLARQPGVISFAAGVPANEFMPVNEYRRALNDVLRRDGAAALQYEEPAGYPPLRETIADYLVEKNIDVTADDILITSGCQQALDMTLRVLAREDSSIVLVEDPCYVGLLDLLTARGLTPIGVPQDEHGIQVTQLEQLILRHRPRLIYVTPTYQNPTGAVMPLARREALLEIATHYGVPILEDSTYDELRYQGDPLPTLKSLDTADMVFHASGFSKTLLPGIRIGYLAIPMSLRARLIATKQTADILTSPLNQRALHAYLETGHFAEHLQQVREAYRLRRDLMSRAAREHFPSEAQWRCPHGGMYFWVQMPTPGPTATDLYMATINYNVAFAIGSIFSANGSFAHAFRLNFANHSETDIEEGMRRLGKGWRELLTRYNGNGHSNNQSTVQIL